mmetsp:Transcript_60331/g.89494  ORF Transcript_60331/g.89494 Transcript_60331/m.89494 type:complete len:112 (-) Transcript_60331:862-1197(-)
MDHLPLQLAILLMLMIHLVFLTQELEPNESSSLKHQFMIHAALDRFEEITLAGDGRGWRTPGSIGANAMWIGLLCPIEELCIYGKERSFVFVSCQNAGCFCASVYSLLSRR